MLIRKLTRYGPMVIAASLLAMTCISCGQPPMRIERVQQAPASGQTLSPDLSVAARLGIQVQEPLADMASAGADGWTWAAPTGWRAMESTPMRLANFAVEGAPGVECYLSVLPGAAGGMLDNLNRWRTQMALPPLTDDDVAGLPTVAMLGVDAPVLECFGEFTPMQGPAQQDAGLIGALAVLPEHTVFVKLTGPADAVRSQRSNFLAFCRSLEAGE